MTSWNATAEKALLKGGVGNAILQSHALSTTQVAVFDAVNSITSRYEPYAVSVYAQPGTDQDATAAAAAHYVLVRFIPSQKALLDGAYTTSLAAIPDGSGKSAGIALGESVAQQIISLRAGDGFTGTGTYVPVNQPGFWQPTPLAFAPAIFPNLSNTTPWMLRSARQFRGKGPHDLSSPRYAADLEEVRTVGALHSTIRTQAQADSANFWYEGSPLTWNRIARPITEARGLSMVDSARLFALLAMGYMDSFIAGFDTKYAYQFWRPVTAIRATSDSSWLPYRVTPAHPDYVSTHSVNGGSAATILARTFGEHTQIVTTGSSTAPKVIKTYDSFRDASIDNSNSRVWGGIHFRKAVSDGRKMGNRIGKLAVRSFLRPIDGDNGDDGDDGDDDNDDPSGQSHNDRSDGSDGDSGGDADGNGPI